jgi:hypothetical protein
MPTDACRCQVQSMRGAWYRRSHSLTESTRSHTVIEDILHHQAAVFVNVYEHHSTHRMCAIPVSGQHGCAVRMRCEVVMCSDEAAMCCRSGIL